MTAETAAGPPPGVEPLFDALLTWDGAGGSWLAPLLLAAPGGVRRFGELASAPGWLQPTIAVRTESGRRGAFEHPSSPSQQLLEWYIAHPAELVAGAAPAATPEVARLRATLLDDDPPGARARAQERARELLRRGVPLAATWWRFEDSHRSDCVLITDRLVLLVRDGDDREPPTPWYPARTGRVRDLEAAQRLAAGEKAWGVLTLSAAPDAGVGEAVVGDAGAGAAEGDAEVGGAAVGEAVVAAATSTAEAEAADGQLAAEVQAGAPHLDAADRAALLAGDIGELSLGRAAAVTGVSSR